MAEEAPIDAKPDAAQTTEPSGWLRALYNEHAAILCLYLRRKYGSGPPEPEDIAQEAFAKIASIPPERQHELQFPKAFLFRIAENLLIDAKRRIRTTAVHASEIAAINFDSIGLDCSPERVLLAKTQLQLAKQAIHAMPENRRRCFVLHRFEGLSCAEIGRQMGISATAVQSHVQRGMADIEKAVVELRPLQDE